MDNESDLSLLPPSPSLSSSSSSLSPIAEEVVVSSPADARVDDDAVSPLSMKSPSPPTIAVPYELQDHLNRKKGSHWSPLGKILGQGQRGRRPNPKYESDSESEHESLLSPTAVPPPDSPDTMATTKLDDAIVEVRRTNGPATKKRKTESGSQQTDLVNRRVVMKKKGTSLKKIKLAFGNVSLVEDGGKDRWHIKFDSFRCYRPEIWTRQQVLTGMSLALKYAKHDRTNIQTDGTKAPPATSSKKKVPPKKRAVMKKKAAVPSKKKMKPPAKPLVTVEERKERIRTYSMRKFEANCAAEDNRRTGTKSVKFSEMPPPPNLRKATKNDDDNNTIMTHAEKYSPYMPYVYGVDYYDDRQVEDDENDTSNNLPKYKPMPLHEQDRHEPKFALPNGIDGSAESLSYYAIPDSFVDEIVINTNKYAEARLGKGKFIPAKRDEILGFFAVYYYMGIVKLPAKRDYWTTDPNWPQHPFRGEISRPRFDFIWRNIHIDGVDTADDIDRTIPRAEDGEFVPEDEQQVEVDDVDSDDEDDSPDPPSKEELEKNERWYKKAEKILDHVNVVSKKLCTYPGFCLSIDEMMKLFKGRSHMTVRMKCKPIKEGFKFYAICDSSTGFVYHFIPDGLRDKQKGTIVDSVLRMVRTLPNRKTSATSTNRKRTYVIAMDNYFTYAKTMVGCREEGVGAFGTARARPGWPPPEFTAITDDRFNSMYLMDDKDNFRIFRWYDNNIVKFVSNIHTGLEGDDIERSRKRPKLNKYNKQNVANVWGQEHECYIRIPVIVNDYNHWMNGVDIADQLIAYYRPKLRCRRTWMPLMFHSLDILRINLYIVHHKMNNMKTQSNDHHKSFTMDLVKALRKRCREAKALRKTGTAPIATRAALVSPDGKSKKKQHNEKKRISNKDPAKSLDPIRLDNVPHTRTWLDYTKRSQCEWCKYEAAIAKLNKTVPPRKTPVKTNKTCSHCSPYIICSEHWNDWHKKP